MTRVTKCCETATTLAPRPTTMNVRWIDVRRCRTSRNTAPTARDGPKSQTDIDESGPATFPTTRPSRSAYPVPPDPSDAVTDATSFGRPITKARPHAFRTARAAVGSFRTAAKTRRIANAAYPHVHAQKYVYVRNPTIAPAAIQYLRFFGVMTASVASRRKSQTNGMSNCGCTGRSKSVNTNGAPVPASVANAAAGSAKNGDAHMTMRAATTENALDDVSRRPTA